MPRVFCKTQAELDAAINAREMEIECAEGSFDISVYYSPFLIVKACLKFSIESRESSAPRIESWGSSAPRIESRGSSAPRIESRESSAPHIKASGYCHISVRGIVFGLISKFCTALIHGDKAKIKGGHQTHCIIKTPADWCEYYGVSVKAGVALVYKGVNDNFNSPHNTCYAPGTKPSAQDWNPTPECGSGLHFSPTPAMTLEFNTGATKFVACPVALSDIIRTAAIRKNARRGVSRSPATRLTGTASVSRNERR